MFYVPSTFLVDLPGLLRRNLHQFMMSNPFCSQEASEQNRLIKAGPVIPAGHQKQSSPADDIAVYDHDRVSGFSPILKMTQSAYREIMDDLVELPFRREKAGMLLGPSEEDDLVTHYIPDKNGRATYSSFTLDAASLNKTLRKYKGVALNCKGVVHVHPPGVLQPSLGDLVYVAQLFANPKNKEATQVMLPIICNGRLYPYLIHAESPREVLIPRLILI
ncbi:hypothetical protein [Gimesia fumaroli]|uniref:MPN domain-containing protein n=1 Tax=Gimesia fumaroli TaxID=2527976 RepID=A0A518I5W4_9PLAN|nr:hypothetical protein [Gimesia fumaroli]QDV48501.1 hypothetical protein Enr17x_05130 [Gimesia fumaroli]